MKLLSLEHGLNLFSYNHFNSLPNGKILALTKFKAFAEKIIVTQKLKFMFRNLENILDKGENAGYQHFLLFSTMFYKAFFF